VAGFAVAAVWLNRRACDRFDRIAGRAERARERSALPLLGWSQRLWLRRKALAVLAILVVAVIFQTITSLRSAISLRYAIAETDRLFPGWRLDDLEAARQRVPDVSNAALRVSGAAHLLPSSFKTSGSEPSLP
jgi:hypothetical protein